MLDPPPLIFQPQIGGWVGGWVDGWVGGRVGGWLGGRAGGWVWNLPPFCLPLPRVVTYSVLIVGAGPGPTGACPGITGGSPKSTDASPGTTGTSLRIKGGLPRNSRGQRRINRGRHQHSHTGMGGWGAGDSRPPQSTRRMMPKGGLGLRWASQAPGRDTKTREQGLPGVVPVEVIGDHCRAAGGGGAGLCRGGRALGPRMRTGRGHVQDRLKQGPEWKGSWGMGQGVWGMGQGVQEQWALG